MKRYDIALFDFDGTLFDTSEGIVNAVSYSLEKLGVFDYDRSMLKKFIGPPLVDSYSRFFGFDSEKSVTATKIFREYYKDKGNTECTLYKGIRELISSLRDRGLRLAVATSKPEFFAVKIAQRFGIDVYFECICGADLNSTVQEKSDAIEKAISLLKADGRSRIIMIGDRSHDIIGAKKTSIDSMGVLYGFGDRDELTRSGADFIAETPQDIYKILCE